jgi:DNA-binding transcriptional ArsR family regulator
MFSTLSHETMLRLALAAAKAANRHVYENRYAGGGRTVKRQPDQHTRHFTGLRSWDYGAKAGVTLATARRHLMALADAGLIFMRPRHRTGAVLTFRLLDEDADRIGRELIEQLRAEGLPWDDEWLAQQNAKRTTHSATRAKGE